MSVGDVVSSWEILTNAPPSLSRGRMCLIFIAVVVVLGNVFRMMVTGSMVGMRGPRTFFINAGSRVLRCQGSQKNQRMRRGKTLSKNKSVSFSAVLMCPVLFSPASSERTRNDDVDGGGNGRRHVLLLTIG